jgi:hypothetical protein
VPRPAAGMTALVTSLAAAVVVSAMPEHYRTLWCVLGVSGLDVLILRSNLVRGTGGTVAVSRPARRNAGRLTATAPYLAQG